jgi:hypothetical protein
MSGKRLFLFKFTRLDGLDLSNRKIKEITKTKED